ncbi:MAG: YihY/virulence factor BrkB family protein [Rhizobiaceae bacterium]|nr:YihY/virulence factor BrkB family protein [Rhizobiaceae bacterium]
MTVLVHILLRLWEKFFDHRVMLIAGGVTYYLLLALFPALAAFVALYGFFADPRTIAVHVALLGDMLPSGGLELIRTQLDALAAQDHGRLSFKVAFGLGFALWSTNAGVKAMFDAMNVAYEEVEKRSFIGLTLQSGLFTIVVLFSGIMLIIALGVIPVVLAFVPIDGFTEKVISIGRWPLLVGGAWCTITAIYRYGPSRVRSKWRWLTWGALLATIAWLLTSIGFTHYLRNFANYNAIYGSLGTVIGFMVWVWLSAMILILGAEVNAAIEHKNDQPADEAAR